VIGGHLLTDRVAIVRRSEGVRDRFGEEQPTWAPPVYVAARVEWEPGSEDRTDADAVVQTRRVILEAGAVVEALDRVLVDGDTWEVDGPPLKHSYPNGQHHIEARLRLVTGA
jgi:hypothetical protein